MKEVKNCVTVSGEAEVDFYFDDYRDEITEWLLAGGNMEGGLLGTYDLIVERIQGLRDENPEMFRQVYASRLIAEINDD